MQVPSMAQKLLTDDSSEGQDDVNTNFQRLGMDNTFRALFVHLKCMSFAARSC